VPDSSLFQQFLANSLTSPASRANYTSGAKIWIEERGGDGSALRAHEPNAVAKGAANLNPHRPKPAPAITPNDLVAVCRHLSTTEDGPTLIAALTLGFFAFLRASNLLCPTTTLWAGPHTLSRKDITTTTDGLLVLITSSKTIGPGSDPVVLHLPRIPGSPACPTQAWVSYTTKVPGSPLSPAFTLSNGSPLIPAQLTATVRYSLGTLGCPYAATFSSHSLRRGGAQAAVRAGGNEADVAAHGTWKSMGGMSAYVPSHSSKRVAASLASLFGPNF
jgi:hypothetical protein